MGLQWRMHCPLSKNIIIHWLPVAISPGEGKLKCQIYYQCVRYVLIAGLLLSAPWWELVIKPIQFVALVGITTAEWTKVYNDKLLIKQVLHNVFWSVIVLLYSLKCYLSSFVCPARFLQHMDILYMKIFICDCHISF